MTELNLCNAVTAKTGIGIQNVVVEPEAVIAEDRLLIWGHAMSAEVQDGIGQTPIHAPTFGQSKDVVSSALGRKVDIGRVNETQPHLPRRQPYRL